MKSGNRQSIGFTGKTLIGSFAAVLACIAAQPAWAVNPTIFTDENNSNSNTSLREAIAQTPADGVITLQTGTYLITLGQISISKNLAFVGQSEAGTVIDANNTSRIFSIDGAFLVQFSKLTLYRGSISSGNGGGILLGNSSGSGPSLVMRECTLKSCRTTGDDGGAISIEDDVGEAEFYSCSFINNSAGTGSSDDGGAVHNDEEDSVLFSKCSFSGNTGDNGGAFMNDPGATATLSTCTFSGNSARNNGGAIFNDSDITLVSCTLTLNTANSDNNSSGDGGGIFCNNPTSGDDVYLTNCVIAANVDGSSSSSSRRPDVYGDTGFNSTGGNLIGDNNGATSDFVVGSPNAKNDRVGSHSSPMNPQLGPLTNNGSPMAHLLLYNSPGVNNGIPASSPGADQHHRHRPHGGGHDCGPSEFTDCNDNNIDDLIEIMNNSSLDANDNGVLDSCEGCCMTDGETEIVIALDVSGSIDNTELGVEVDGLKSCLDTSIPVNGKVRLGVVVYANGVNNLVAMRLIDDAGDIPAIKTALDGLLSNRTVPTNATNIGQALINARALLTGAGSITANDYILLIGDGKANTGPNVATECRNTANAHIVICAISVGASAAGKAQFRDCATETGGEWGDAPTPADFGPICMACFSSITSSCRTTNSEHCAAIGGTYQGDGTSCGGGPPAVTPVITNAVAGKIDLNASCQATIQFTITIEDDSCVDKNTMNLQITASNIGDPAQDVVLGPVVTQTPVVVTSKKVRVSGTVAVSGLTGCSADVRIMASAGDCCGTRASGYADVIINQGLCGGGAPTVSVVITNAVAGVINLNASCQATVQFTVTIEDDTCLNLANWAFQVSATNVGDPNQNVTIGSVTTQTPVMINSKKYTVSGSAPISALVGCSADVRISASAKDCCGALGSGSSDVVIGKGACDTAPPTVTVAITNAVGGAINLNASCQATIQFTVTIEDDACVTPATMNLLVTPSNTGDATQDAILGAVTLQPPVQVNSKKVTVSGSVPVTGLIGCAADVRIAASAADCCGASGGGYADVIINKGSCAGTPPTVTVAFNNAPGGVIELNASCMATIQFTVTIEDEACLSPTALYFQVSATNVGDPNQNVTIGSVTTQSPVVVNSKKITISGAVPVSALVGCAADVRITASAKDCCGTQGSGYAELMVTAGACGGGGGAPSVTVAITNAPATNASCQATIQFTVTIMDNACVSPSGLHLTVTATNVGDPNINVTTIGTATTQTPVVVNSKKVTVAGSVTVTGLNGCSADVRICAMAMNCCGIFGSGCADVAVLDNTKPVFTVCPPPIVLTRGDKICSNGADAWINSARAVDNCGPGGPLTVTNDSGNLGYECGFPPDSTTVVTWSATDACGNTQTCTSTITITPAPKLEIGQKGSVLVWPHVELRWNAAGQIIRDTFISVTNDYATAGVRLKLFFVNGDNPIPPYGPLQGTTEPGWNYFDNIILLTHDEPAYWSSYTGQDGNGFVTTPFTVLDPNGRLQPDGTYLLRGFIVGFAIGNAGTEIRFNHLKGSGLVIDYASGKACEYATWGFKSECGPHGAEVPDCISYDARGVCCATGFVPGCLALDGFSYDATPDQLLLEFYAANSGALGTTGVNRIVDTQLTIVPMIHNFTSTRPMEAPPTDIKIDVWNQDEVKLTNLHRCFQCWDSTLFTVYGNPNYFVRANLGSDKGKARLKGATNAACDRQPNPNASPPVTGLFSVTAPLLGIAQRFYKDGNNPRGCSILELNAVGVRTDAKIIYAPQVDPPELNDPNGDEDIFKDTAATEVRTNGNSDASASSGPEGN